MFALLIVFVIGCRIVSVPDAQQTPILTSLMFTITQIGYLLWAKVDTDRRLNKIETKTEAAARREDCPPEESAAELKPPGGP
jgi:hypothetical protein